MCGGSKGVGKKHKKHRKQNPNQAGMSRGVNPNQARLREAAALRQGRMQQAQLDRLSSMNPMQRAALQRQMTNPLYNPYGNGLVM